MGKGRAGHCRAELLGTDPQWLFRTRNPERAALVYVVRTACASLGWWRAAGQTRLLKARSLLLAPPGMDLTGAGWGPFFYLELPAEFWDQARGAVGVRSGFLSAQLDLAQAVALEVKCSEIIFESGQRPAGWDMAMTHLAASILVRSLRLARPVPVQASTDKGLFLYGHLLDRLGGIIADLEGDPAQRLTLKELAGRAKMSISLLQRVFLDFMRMSPPEYRKALRMARAGELLIQGLGSDQIASTLGFPEARSFYRDFRQFWKTTPRQWRRDTEERLAALAILVPG